MLNFNAKGLLIPNLNISSNLAELEKEFVFNIDSEKRKILFANYIEYSRALNNKLEYNELVQWIDGSFISKKPEPHDIDIVSFIDYREFENDATKFDDFKYPLSLISLGLDAYIVIIYPREHKNYPLYIGDRLYWMDLFDKTKRSRNGLKNPKGFLELTFR